MAGHLDRGIGLFGMSQSGLCFRLASCLAIQRERVFIASMHRIEVAQIEQRLSMFRIEPKRCGQPLFALGESALQLIRVSQVAQDIRVLGSGFQSRLIMAFRITES